MPGDPARRHFRFLDASEFEKLSTEEKLAYLEQAVIEAHKMHHPERPLPDRED